MEHIIHDHLPVLKKMDVSENISVSLPAHVWISFWSAYAHASWQDGAASVVALVAQEAVLDEDWVQEQSERRQEQVLSYREHLSRLFGANNSEDESGKGAYL